MEIASRDRKRRGLIGACAIGIAICVARSSLVMAQSEPADKIVEQMEQKGCAVLETRIQVCKYDYSVNGKVLEAISFRPAGDGPFPGVLLIPGYQRTARNFVPRGILLAQNGFASVAVSQPGFGKSTGPPDFVGPKTMAALTEGYRRLRQESYVDPARMGIFGYSRGAMAASLLAVDLDDVKAAVFGAGIYDFQRAYDDSTLPGARKNMRDETGMTKEAVRERSSILRMDRLKCPVLILHGEKDVNVPVSQALLLRDRLTQLHKEFEIKLFPGREHSIGPEVNDLTVDFFRRKLAPTAAAAGHR
jgi:dipeptidyl aminopeptidase/acylaminoacyl peptidase